MKPCHADNSIILQMLGNIRQACTEPRLKSENKPSSMLLQDEEASPVNERMLLQFSSNVLVLDLDVLRAVLGHTLEQLPAGNGGALAQGPSPFQSNFEAFALVQKQCAGCDCETAKTDTGM